MPQPPNRPTRPAPTRSTYGQRSRFGLAQQLLLLAVLLVLLAVRWILQAAAASRLEADFLERSQLLEQAAEPAE